MMANAIWWKRFIFYSDKPDRLYFYMFYSLWEVVNNASKKCEKTTASSTVVICTKLQNKKMQISFFTAKNWLKRL